MEPVRLFELLASFRALVDEEGAKQLPRTGNRRYFDAVTRPRHFTFTADSRIQHWKTRDGADGLGCALIERDVTLGKAFGIAGLDTAEERVNRVMASVEPVIQIREDREFASVRPQWSEQGSERKIRSRGFGKKPIRVHAERVANAHEAARRFSGCFGGAQNGRGHHVQHRERKADAESAQKAPSIQMPVLSLNPGGHSFEPKTCRRGLMRVNRRS